MAGDKPPPYGGGQAPALRRGTSPRPTAGDKPPPYGATQLVLESPSKLQVWQHWPPLKTSGPQHSTMPPKPVHPLGRLQMLTHSAPNASASHSSAAGHCSTTS